MKRPNHLATLLLAAALLAGCGQKGPLFIPEKKGEAVATPAPDSTVPQQSSNSGADVAAAERARQEAARRAAGN